MKRIPAAFLALLLVLSCAGCGSMKLNSIAPKVGESTSWELPSVFDGSLHGLEMSVSRDTGKLSVTRMPLSFGAGGAKGWTVFVYLCGSDLESEDGSATDDMLEMIDGASGSGVRFVVETGGSDKWMNNMVSSSRLERYLIEKGDIELVDSQPADGMGREETMREFLQWGVDNYASEHMAVVLWNHGGGSISGVCFDETDGYDSLTLRELDGALLSVCGSTGRKFDLIGFDACLMGSLEAANILASYAGWMVASQETEPGTGWSYDAIGRFLGANPDADGKELGAVVCDSYYESCREIEDDNLCTLSLIDLSGLDALLVSFNDFAHGLYDSAADAANCAAMIRGISQADNFGGNNRAEGYTNMVDLGGIISACEDYAGGAVETLAALENAVAYSVLGAGHSTASGLSIYYPLSVQGSEELTVFSDICPSPYYISFVDRQNQGSVSVNAADSYDDSFWFDDSGSWNWGGFSTGSTIDYWEFLDGYEQTGDSQLITFSVPPHLDEDGDFWFQLDDNGYRYASDVYGLVYELSADGEDLIELGQTYDLRGGWDTRIFMDDFDGYWLSLPDGQNLAIYIVESTDDSIIYTSPILLNDVETNLRLRYDYDRDAVFVEGAWDGLTDYGAASREIIKLQPGDVIVPRYYAYAIDSDDEYTYYGGEFVVTLKTRIYYDIMEDGDYYFSFCIDDIYGDYYLSDSAAFNVEDGEVYFYDD